ncbi:hypothetical protein AGABI2DRAFT_175700 [Agaricus bisporus var. bisporus H97]|uniref:hypothetical protein n=1 Tax=Agaricus bisporus var. bisporus (strain H97 / ATCC MYA-4626 / FGSC 10389) TaxID=936046 RepID=UPI00029F5D55|nr:hypothetical protein AGABI2DRAFT_175700 [Agaricus bisporus var. bisporus H97]EKV50982.1 hypothetical protein AGABI2DRAFT_175700 [Agaricus bisporus var. bisporus H97]
MDPSPLVDVLRPGQPSSLSSTYLTHLTTLPLPELTREPVSLQTQLHHLTASLTSFTHTSYPTFISLHQTTTALTSSIESLSASLTNLLDTSLPALEENTAAWKTRTDTVLRERNKARVVLEQHEKIRDLLDIPVLIDTCVRNGYFAEALSLASHVTALAGKAHENNSPPPAILTSVLSEVQYSITQMHLSLLETLYEPNRKLPALWKAVNFLRKMDAFASDASTHSKSRPHAEEHLALAFLIGRESCLKAILEPISRDIQRLVNQVTDDQVVDQTDDTVGTTQFQHKSESTKELDEREKEDLARHLKKYIDAWRECIYDIVTQYATIFLERSSTHSETTQDEDLFSRLHTLLRTYSTRALSTHLYTILQSSLPLLTLTHLPSLLTQLNYCSTAFSRLGLDFRSILIGGGGLFSSAILAIVKRDFETAVEKWMARVEKARGTTGKNGLLSASASSNRISAKPAELPSKWLVLPSLVSSPPVPSSSDNIELPHIPPHILSSYPPLAELTNAILGVLNGLRLVVLRSPNTPISAEGVSELLLGLDEIVLNRGSSGLMDYLKLVVSFLDGDVERGGGDVEKVRGREGEGRVVSAVGRVFFDVFGGFVRRALVEGVYGVRLDGLKKGKGEGWFERKNEFEEMCRSLGVEESESEDEEDEESEKE